MFTRHVREALKKSTVLLMQNRITPMPPINTLRPWSKPLLFPTSFHPTARLPLERKALFPALKITSSQQSLKLETLGNSMTILIRPIKAVTGIFSKPRHVALGYKGKIYGVGGEGASAMFKPMTLVEDSTREWTRAHVLDIGPVHAEKIFHSFTNLPADEKLNYLLLYHNCYTPVIYALLNQWPKINDDAAVTEHTKKLYLQTISGLLSDNIGIGTISAIRALFQKGILDMTNAPLGLSLIKAGDDYDADAPPG